MFAEHTHKLQFLIQTNKEKPQTRIGKLKLDVIVQTKTNIFDLLKSKLIYTTQHTHQFHFYYITFCCATEFLHLCQHHTLFRHRENPLEIHSVVPCCFFAFLPFSRYFLFFLFFCSEKYLEDYLYYAYSHFMFLNVLMVLHGTRDIIFNVSCSWFFKTETILFVFTFWLLL